MSHKLKKTVSFSGVVTKYGSSALRSSNTNSPLSLWKRQFDCGDMSALIYVVIRLRITIKTTANIFND